MITTNSKISLFDGKINCDIQQNVAVTIYPEDTLTPPSTLDEDGNEVTFIVNDVYDFFNQQRIEQLGADGIRDFLSRHYPSSSAISDYVSKLSDDELLESVKPRNVQSPSELMSWSRWLNSQIDSRITESNHNDTVLEDNNTDSSESSESSVSE